MNDVAESVSFQKSMTMRIRSLIAVLVPLLLLTALPRVQAQITETHTFSSQRLVPDGNAAGLSDVRTISSSIASIAGLRVRLLVTGEFNGDLYAYVRHSTGFTVLLNRVGRDTTNWSGYADGGFNVTFETEAQNGDIHFYRNSVLMAADSPLIGSWEPDGRTDDPSTVSEQSSRTTSLESFNGLDAAGEWTLYMVDLESGGTNVLVGWELEIFGQTRSFPVASSAPVRETVRLFAARQRYAEVAKRPNHLAYLKSNTLRPQTNRLSRE